MSLSQPTPTDPQQGIQLGQQVASQQQGYNNQAGLQSQSGSMVDQGNVFGNLSYKQVGTNPDGTPKYAATTSLSTPEQGLFNNTVGTQGLAGNSAQNLLQHANYGGQDPSKVIGDATSGNTAAILKNETDYLNPFFTTQRDQLDTKLKNQGLLPGQPAYDNAMRGLDTNQGTTVSNFLAQAEPQAYSQALSSFEEPGKLAGSLFPMGAPTTPNSSFVNAPGLNIGAANLTGAVGAENQALNDQYKAKQSQYNSTMSGLFGIPTAVLGGLATGGLGPLGGLGIGMLGGALGGGGAGGSGSGGG